ncbi:MAG TPA: hypothetical protein VFH53_06015 [Phycisphaerae bacterium]|nr:hypothetical protein [Phycisphaerae bacterium]HUX02245.1 hypothetical protein [Phycisphaerae bacterium]
METTQTKAQYLAECREKNVCPGCGCSWDNEDMQVGGRSAAGYEVCGGCLADEDAFLDDLDD